MSSKMTVKKEAIMARFGGMGFHNSEANVWREMDDVQFNQYVGKVYRELSPGFSRMWGGFPEWTKEEMDAFAEYCEKMQCKVGATIYLTGHCVRYETDEELTMSFLVYSAWIISTREPIRTMKNSSRLEAVMLKNFSRSNNRSCLSRASDSTLLLNKSQLSSRFVYNAGF